MPGALTPNAAGALSGLRLQDGDDVKEVYNALNYLNEANVSAADNGTTQTLTAAMVTGSGQVFHTSTGGATPTLTMPTAAAIIAAIPGFQVGQAYVLRIINGNSGTATVAAGTGITTTGTLTLAAATWRDFVITYTGQGALSMVSVGTGTNS